MKLATQNQLIASAQPNYIPTQPIYVSPQPVYAPVQPQYIPPPQQHIIRKFWYLAYNINKKYFNNYIWLIKYYNKKYKAKIFMN